MQRPDAQRERILPLLEELGGLTPGNVKKVHELTRVPEADIWGTGSFYTLLKNPGTRTRVCKGLTCKLRGADSLIAQLRASGAEVEAVSCLGQCDRAPVGLDPHFDVISHYQGPRDVTPANDLLPLNLGGERDMNFEALAKARSMTPAAIIEALKASGLQGRGGAGFPAHFKWNAVSQQLETERYVVCNADEGEPGTFKDREVMLRRPERMLEGLAIAAHTISAKEIFIYIRGEFKAELEALEACLAEAGPTLSDWDWHFHKGHGAYICGEETALIESLEGKRGMPRLKPPFPTECGFRNKPTLMHNVETIACVPYILTHGGEAFRAMGRAEAGSKLYCISGHIRQPGVYELPLGATLDELVDAAGGYEGTPIAFSPGGASSGFLPIAQRTLPLDYKSLGSVGSMLGSAGVVVLNDTVDMAQMALWQLEFFEEESCGQCAPCRIGTRYLHRQLHQYLTTGNPQTLTHAADVGWEMEEGSICGLGMIAAKPLEMARQHFPEAFRNRAMEV